MKTPTDYFSFGTYLATAVGMFALGLAANWRGWRGWPQLGFVAAAAGVAWLYCRNSQRIQAERHRARWLAEAERHEGGPGHPRDQIPRPSAGVERSKPMACHATLNLTGQTFGRWQVIARASPGWWKCVCQCGNQTTVRQLSLRSGNTKSCGCLRKEMRKHIGGPNPENLERRFVSLREQGLSIHAIGKLTGVSYQTVLNHLRRLGLYKSLKIRHLEKFRDQVVALRKQHLTCAAIAQQIGICTDTVVRILKAQGPLRPLYAKPRDLTGERYGKLLVVQQLNSKRCICVCDCGKRKNVYRPSLKNGCIRSCGCLRREWRLRLHGARPRV